MRARGVVSLDDAPHRLLGRVLIDTTIAVEAGLGRDGAQRDVRVRNRAFARTRTALERWTAYLASVDWVRGELAGAVDAIPAVMHATGLRSNDALMTATAISLGCDGIATTDRQFGRVHEQDVPTILAPRDRVAEIRGLRARARRI